MHVKERGRRIAASWVLPSVLFVCGACSGDHDHPPPLSDAPSRPDRAPESTRAFESVPCWTGALADYATECGYVTVPLHADAPKDGSIRLAVAIVYSNASRVSGDPVVYLDGGPGAASIEAMLDDHIPFDAVLRDRDLVLVDQRGTGLSEPSPRCTVDTDAGAGADPTAPPTSSAGLDALRACRDDLVQQGFDLSAYRSSESAADVVAIAKALGYEHLSLYGISYGTRYALTTLRDQPAVSREVILDSVVPLQVDLLAEQGGNVYAAIHALAGACSAQPDCSDTFGDVEQKELETVERMDESPPTVQLSDGSSVTVPAALAASLFVSLMYSGELIPYIPEIVERIHGGDYGVFADLLGGKGRPVINQAVYLSVVCAEEAPFSSEEALAAKSQDIPESWRKWVTPQDIFAACAAWDVPSAPAIENEPVESDARALVVSGGYDPVTPPAYGKLAAEHLSRSQSFVVATQGHGASISDCGRGLVHGFLDGSKLGECGGSDSIAFDVPGTLSLSSHRVAAAPRFVTSRDPLPETIRAAVRRTPWSRATPWLALTAR